LVDIVKSDIVKIANDYDVIVNSTGQKIVDGGASCQAILAAAGPLVKNDILAKYPNGIESGAFMAVGEGVFIHLTSNTF